MSKSIAIVIDNANTLNTAHELKSEDKDRIQIDYYKLLKSLIGKDVRNAHFYFIARQCVENMGNYYKLLVKNNFEIIIPNQTLAIKDDWDDDKIVSVLENLIDDDTINTVILLSGDFHFYESLCRLRTVGKHVVIASTEIKVCNKILKDVEFIEIKDIINQSIISIDDQFAGGGKNSKRFQMFRNKKIVGRHIKKFRWDFS